jgi:hypothetical protein
VPTCVTLEPEEFKLVDFDPAEVIGVVEGLLDTIGLDRPVHLVVDQTTPLVHAEVRSIDPLVLFCESGALEDPRRLRQFSRSGAENVLGRMLYRVHDRLDPAFGDPPPEGELTLQQEAAWDAYAIGRLVRQGHSHFEERQRRLYQFRTRHGFSDAGDAAFAALWEGVGLTWSDLDRLSADANTRAA